MKKLFIIGLALVFLEFVPSTVTYDLTQSSGKTASTNYLIARYVIGSGGVIGATGANYIHFATAGETVVGGMQNAKNVLLSGFWNTSIFGPTEVEQQENTMVPKAFELHQNYPNPFNPQTTIEYDLPDASRVTVEIFNLVGQRIRLLLNSKNQGPGYMQVVWDGHDDSGRLMGSGVYLCRLIISKASLENQETAIVFQQIQKMLLIK